jgi:hypothetical protein
MKALPLAVMLALSASCATAPPPVVVKDIDFREELRRYGEWIVVAPYGRVWHPSTALVGENFTPYLTGGGWVHAADGWNFESQWAWGKYVFHYGRWVVADDLGWLWVPSQQRGTAWVGWRTGDGHTGWSPLPPDVKNPRARAQPWLYTKTKYLSAREAIPFQLKSEEVAKLHPQTEPLPASGPPVEQVKAVGGLDRDVQLPVPPPVVAPEPPPEPPKEEEPPPPPPKKKGKTKPKKPR